MKKLLFLIVAAIVVVTVPNVKAAENCEEISSFEELKTALNNKCSTITLSKSANIDVTEAIGIGYKVEIVGNESTIKWTGETDSQLQPQVNATIITSINGGDVTISNVTIKDSRKYGLQAYNGGKLTIDNVKIENCNYGAVLVNGGDVTVKSLTMKDNGEKPGGNGIEIGRASADYATPKLTLDGTVTVEGDTQTNYVTIAENDKDLISFEVENTPSSAYKLEIKDNKVIIVNQEGKIIAESNKAPETVVNIKGTEYVEPTINTTEEVKDNTKNPNTSDTIIYSIIAIVISAIGLAFTYKKLHNN